MDSQSLNQISLQIKQARKEKGWTQQQLADYSGLDRTTIGSLERNDYNDMGIRKVQRILELLGKTLSVSYQGLPTLDQLQNDKVNYHG
jgi:transcriptional regulator with XRE-family HTH domain